MEKSMTRAICGSSTSIGLPSFPIFQTLTTKGSLINLSLCVPGKREAIMFEFVDGSRSLSAHVMNGILIS
jgi:hypothetical protein